MITPEQIKKLRELSREATPGPWRYSYGDQDGNNRRCLFDSRGYLFGQIDDGSNGEVIAELRNNIDPLLDYVEKLEKVREAAETFSRSQHPITISGNYEFLREALAALETEK